MPPVSVSSQLPITGSSEAVMDEAAIQESQQDKKSPEDETGDRDWIFSVADITEVEDILGDRIRVKATPMFHQLKAESDKFVSNVLQLKRRQDSDKKLLDIRLIINSDIIQNAIREVLGFQFSLNLISNPIVFLKPYYPLFHYRAELYEYAESNERTDEEKKHLAVLIEFMQINLQKMVTVYDHLVPNGLITFKALQSLIKPQTLIVSQDDEAPECFYVGDVNVATRADGAEYIRIQCFRWQYDGTKFGPEKVRLQILSFDGVKKWTSAIKRMKATYLGLLWSTNNEPSSEQGDMHIDERIILDHQTFFKYNIKSQPLLERTAGAIDMNETIRRIGSSEPRELDVEEVSTKVELRKAPILLDFWKTFVNKESVQFSDTQALLCPAKLPCFALKTQVWGRAMVDKVKPITWARDAFEVLQMDPAHKRTIQTLVAMRKEKAVLFDDVIAGKGQGLVFLLHGPPGGGKTLTAEAIAEYVQQPLYCITSGKLGTTPMMAEKELLTAFNLAKSWNAILLLDEADVFLAKRTTEDIERNAFVSIFLHHLEWYKGIMFLTSNRPQQFDEAFQSRIHLAIYYPPLTDHQRANIWKCALASSHVPAEWKEDTWEKFGTKYKLNGREIKNIASLSKSIAASLQCPLNEEILDMVYRINTNGKAIMIEEE
ncbi:hypothetical protein ONZ43_g3363 [Nemania bipapillata]|uniref:Uncharacterized protein n=1 Tax=Nemania bipapillata TaxID=110536 RepID=A0ACC2IX48_9PEZI|nr:hypothetical protein ONZ43_g3363 [Nemania bipapillata]